MGWFRVTVCRRSVTMVSVTILCLMTLADINGRPLRHPSPTLDATSSWPAVALRKAAKYYENVRVVYRIVSLDGVEPKNGS